MGTADANSANTDRIIVKIFIFVFFYLLKILSIFFQVNFSGPNEIGTAPYIVLPPCKDGEDLRNRVRTW